MTTPLCPAIRATLRDEAASLRARLARIEADMETIDSPDVRLDEVYEVGRRTMSISESRLAAAHYSAAQMINHGAVRSETYALRDAAGGDR